MSNYEPTLKLSSENEINNEIYNIEIDKSEPKVKITRKRSFNTMMGF